MQEHTIRCSPNQNFQAFVRYVVDLAQGARVDIDTSRKPYAVKVDKPTLERWKARLPKAPAPAAPKPVAHPQHPAPAPAPAAAPAPAPEVKAAEEPQARHARPEVNSQPAPKKRAAKRTTKRAQRNTNTGE